MIAPFIKKKKNSKNSSKFLYIRPMTVILRNQGSKEINFGGVRNKSKLQFVINSVLILIATIPHFGKVSALL